MVALLHPHLEPASNGPRSTQLRLVVDNGPRRRPDSASGVVPQRVEIAGVVLERAAVIGLIVAAVVLFGGLLLVRLGQGSPAASTWSGLESSTPTGAVSAPVVNVGDQLWVVNSGDSMWSIAQELAPGTDPRPLVAALIDANGTESLQIGQQIVIPGQLLD